MTLNSEIKCHAKGFEFYLVMLRNYFEQVNAMILSILTYSFHGNCCLFGKNIFHVHGINHQ